MIVVLVNCFDTYNERVNSVQKYFMSKGHIVQTVTSDYMHIEKRRISPSQKNGYLYVHVPAYHRNLSVARLRSHACFAKGVVKQIEKMQPALIYVLIPPNSLVKELSSYKKQHDSVKLIYDIIDMWPETLPIPFGKSLFFFSFWKKIRDKNIGYADYIITECDLYQKFLNKAVTKNKVMTIHLTRKKCKQEEIRHMIKETLDICYLGSINNLLDINMLCGVLKQLSSKYKVIFHIIGKGENELKLLNKLHEIPIQVLNYGAIYDKKKKRDIFAQCDFGVNLMKVSVCVGLTMKSIDYFEAGLPIINNIKGDTYDYVNKYDIGVNVDHTGIVDLKKIDNIIENMDATREKVLQLYKSEFTEEIFERKMNLIYDEMVGRDLCKSE